MSRDLTVPLDYPLESPQLLLVFIPGEGGPYHLMRQGWLPETEPARGEWGVGSAYFCDMAEVIDSIAYEALTGKRYVEGEPRAITEIVRALHLCERMCSECADLLLDGDRTVPARRSELVR